MKNKLMSYRVRSMLCTFVAAIAVVLETPNTWFWLYEPKKPAKFNKK